MTDLALTSGEREFAPAAARARRAGTWFIPSPSRPMAPARMSDRRETCDAAGCEQQAAASEAILLISPPARGVARALAGGNIRRKNGIDLLESPRRIR